MRRPQMLLKRRYGNSAVRFERQKRRSDPLHLAAKSLPCGDGSDVHRFAFTIFNRSANSEFL
jgi:hypothetical protein